MAKPVVTVIYRDGSKKETKILPRVEVNAELKFKKGMGELQKLGQVEVLYWMTFEALRISGQLEDGLTYEAWLDQIEDVETEETGGDVDGQDDPTRDAQ